MEPRILLLTKQRFARSLKTIYREESPYTFVDYTSGLNPSDIESFLQEKKDTFDAVLVLAEQNNTPFREAMEKSYEGHKIAFRVHPVEFTEVYLPEDTYMMEVNAPLKKSEFDELVEKHFADL